MVTRNVGTVRINFARHDYDAKVDQRGRVVALCILSDYTDFWKSFAPNKQALIQKKVNRLMAERRSS